jgi:DNA-binding XRE family transcriptional regulator
VTGDVEAAPPRARETRGVDLLGARIREARLGRGMSLRETAARAGISPSLLSQVETGKVQPSVTTLYAVVTCLDLSIDEILDHQPSGEPWQLPRSSTPVQRAADAPSITMGNGVTWQGLAVMSVSDHVDGVLATYAPRAASSVEDSLTRHPGVEYGYLVAGELTLRLEDEIHVLRAGDSFCFDSQRPHLYVNHTDAEAQGVWYVVNGTRHGAPDADATTPASPSRQQEDQPAGRP